MSEEPSCLPLEHPLDRTPDWPPTPTDIPGDVPERYFGVWSRTLLETPHSRDTHTLVRWMQLGQWHADLRVPTTVGAPMQGFSGITRVAQVDTSQGAREKCTWQRIVDLQPPRCSVDEGWMVFDTPERVLETGLHESYFEVWDRLPGSTGRRIVLSEAPRADGMPVTRLFISGQYMMRVRPALPLSADFEISFGTFNGARFCIEASTVSALTGSGCGLSIARVSAHEAEVWMNGARASWCVLEWAGGPAP